MFVRRIRREQGISTVVVAVSMLGIFGALVFSLDAGNLWTSRRAMVTATDEAALVGARSAIGWTSSGPCPTHVVSAVTSKLSEQEPTASLEACTLEPVNDKAGYVTVEARKPVEVRFGPVLGLRDQSVYSSTSVAYGYPESLVGLRPMGVCAENPHVQEWLALKDGLLTEEDYLDLATTEPGDHAVGPTGGLVHQVYFNKANARNCGGADDAAGNWGWMDYNGSANGNMNNDVREWTQTGYMPDIHIHEDPEPCTVEDPEDGCLAGTTGTRGNSIDTEMTLLKESGITVWIPIFDAAAGPGNNVLFTVRGVIGMIVRDYVSTGAEKFHHFDVEFVDVVRSGGCCSRFGMNTGALATTICGIDHDPASTDDRCEPAS